MKYEPEFGRADSAWGNFDPTWLPSNHPALAEAGVVYTVGGTRYRLVGHPNRRVPYQVCPAGKGWYEVRSRGAKLYLYRAWRNGDGKRQGQLVGRVEREGKPSRLPPKRLQAID